jgi:Ni/Co efflux regulator RcnB
MRALLTLLVLVSVAVAAPAFAQKKDRDATSTGITEKQRQKELDEWRTKGEKYMQEQEVVQKKRKACSATAKEQKLRLTKRRDFMRGCMAA